MYKRQEFYDEHEIICLSAALQCSSLTVFAANKPDDTKAKPQDHENTQTIIETAIDSETDEYDTQLTDMDIYYTTEVLLKTPQRKRNFPLHRKAMIPQITTWSFFLQPTIRTGI